MPSPVDSLMTIMTIAANNAIPVEGKAWGHSKVDVTGGAWDTYCSMATSGAVPAGASGAGPATRI